MSREAEGGQGWGVERRLEGMEVEGGVGMEMRVGPGEGLRAVGGGTGEQGGWGEEAEGEGKNGDEGGVWGRV